MIAIVDTGGANLASVTDALSRLGHRSAVTSDPETIHRASRVILPGVGAAGDSMARLRRSELVACLKALKQPTLGICLGMQLLFESSEEGEARCLGILPGRVSRFPVQREFPVPHMGWNQLIPSAVSSRLLREIPEDRYFYFVHSYRVPDGDWVVAHCDYGGSFPAVVERENFFGTQFHPEKSARAGAQLLRNFLEL